MAVPRKDTPILSPLSINQPGRGSESIRSEKPSGIPVPSRATNVASIGLRPASTSGPVRSNSVSHRFLSPTEWARVAHGVGAIREGETHAVVHPTCWYWPPKGLPDGLYRDVIFQKIKNHYCYHILSTLRWMLMVVQIIIGAVLTALGSLSKDNSVPIMVLAAINTVTAGLLALMHNSGLPDRYRMNKVQFDNVEDFLGELLDAGIIDNGQTVDQVLSDCFTRYLEAKATVTRNMPDYYAATPARPRSTVATSGPDVDNYGHVPHIPL